MMERFWSKVDVRSTMECWIWQAARDKDGYGKFFVQGKVCRAPRYSYELTRGPISEGLTVHHLCNNRLCVNPIHLETVRHRTNILLGNGKAAKQTRTLTCFRGHPLYGDNLYLYPRGFRGCRTCRKELWSTNERIKKYQDLKSMGGMKQPAHSLGE
jgi:hypothetical protein